MLGNGLIDLIVDSFFVLIQGGVMPLYQTLGVPLGDEGDIQNKNILQLIKEVFAVGKQRGLQELLRCQQQNIRLVALVEFS